MPVYRRVVGPRPGSDGARRPGAHAPYYLVVESVTDAWEQLLRDLGDGALIPAETGVVRIAFDYRHEVFVAPAEIEVEVVRVGGSSVEFAVRLHQDGRLAVEAQIVVVRVTADRAASTPLSERQRAALEAVAVPVSTASD